VTASDTASIATVSPAVAEIHESGRRAFFRVGVLRLFAAIGISPRGAASGRPVVVQEISIGSTPVDPEPKPTREGFRWLRGFEDARRCGLNLLINTNLQKSMGSASIKTSRAAHPRTLFEHAG
jgi:hypothetical protein